MSLFEELKRRNVFRVGIAYGVTAWLLIQISDTVFPRIGLSESAVTLVIALLGIGFIPALIFAWAFEMTPDGIRRERDVDRAESITPQTGKKLDRMIILALAVVVAWFLFDEYYLEPRQQQQMASELAAKPKTGTSIPETKSQETGGPDQKSIAVLPFVNMSAESENEYFSDGISEELLNVLVRVNDLEVASRTSSFAYKGKDLPLSQVARELGVNHILEGSVRKAGNRVRITAQLIDAGSDRHLWSETYERQLDDIFDIQEEISNHIVDALKVALDVDEAAAIERLHRPTENTEAYELYLQGRYKWRQRLEENIRASIALFEQAIEIDPNFAKAHEALAAANVVLPSWSNVPPEEAIAEARIHAERALSIDPRLAEARAVIAEMENQNLEWARALDQYEEALENEPRNATVHQWYAEALADVGYIKLALDQIEQAYQLDPASPVINNVYTFIASVAGEDELAIRRMNTALELGIDTAVFNALSSLRRLGHWDTIEQQVIPLVETFGGGEISRACFEAQRDASAKPQLERLLVAVENEVVFAGRNAYCSAVAGRFDLALKWAREDLSQDPGHLGRYWDVDQVQQAIRSRDDFKALLKKLKLVQLYQARGWPDRCRPSGAEDFTCD